MPTESFLIAPTTLSVSLHSYRMLAYHVSKDIQSFGMWFDPRYIVGAGLLDG